MNKFVALLLLVSTNVLATPEELIAGLILHQAINDSKEKTKPGSAVVGYPVPVHGPQVIVVPQCTANYPCPQVILQCDTLPVVDQWGRIISYQKTCR